MDVGLDARCRISNTARMNSLAQDTDLRALLDRLHAESDAQKATIGAYFEGGAERQVAKGRAS